MRKLTSQTFLSFLVAGTLTSGIAAGPSIGTATARGSFSVERSKVWGNATLTDGSTIETATASPELRLSNGAQVRLGADSRATVYESRLVLEKGIGEISSAKHYQMDAGALRIVPASATSIARVQSNGANHVRVEAAGGAVRVSNATGGLLAKVAAGSALDFDMQASSFEASRAGAAPAVTKIDGCLVRTNGKFYVLDQTTGVTFEVQGNDVAGQVGNRVTASGMIDPASIGKIDTPDVLRVDALHAEGGGCSAPVLTRPRDIKTAAIISGVVVTGGTAVMICHWLDCFGEGKSTTSR